MSAAPISAGGSTSSCNASSGDPSSTTAVVPSASATKATNAWLTKLDLPDPETPVTDVNTPSGKAASNPSRLLILTSLSFNQPRAARVAAIAHGGQILLSETAAALARDSLPAGGSLRDLGPHRLKDLGQAEHIFQLQAEGLPTEFPALRSLDNPALANNLPAQSATFIGRERELEEVRALILTTRLITMTGAGGSGKTIACGICHGDSLEGLGAVPRLAGLHPAYVARQLYAFQTGTNHSVSSALMKKVVANLTPDDILAIAAYAAAQ